MQPYGVSKPMDQNPDLVMGRQLLKQFCEVNSSFFTRKVKKEEGENVLPHKQDWPNYTTIETTTQKVADETWSGLINFIDQTTTVEQFKKEWKEKFSFVKLTDSSKEGNSLLLKAIYKNNYDLVEFMCEEEPECVNTKFGRQIPLGQAFSGLGYEPTTDQSVLRCKIIYKLLNSGADLYSLLHKPHGYLVLEKATTFFKSENYFSSGDTRITLTKAQTISANVNLTTFLMTLGARKCYIDGPNNCLAKSRLNKFEEEVYLIAKSRFFTSKEKERNFIRLAWKDDHSLFHALPNKVICQIFTSLLRRPPRSEYMIRMKQLTLARAEERRALPWTEIHYGDGECDFIKKMPDPSDWELWRTGGIPGNYNYDLY
jgi:hypothetical protein